MPRVDIPVTQIAIAGATPPSQTSSVSASGHSFEGNDGRLFLEVTNVGGTAETVTVSTPLVVGGLTVSPLTVSVPSSSAVRHIGPFAPTIFSQPGTDTVYVDCTTNYLRFRAYRL